MITKLNKNHKSKDQMSILSQQITQINHTDVRFWIYIAKLYELKKLLYKLKQCYEYSYIYSRVCIYILT